MLRIRAFGAITAIVLGVSGCGNGGGDASSKPQTNDPKAKPTTPRRGGHIVLPSNEPRSLNPAIQSRFDRATPLIYEGLVGLDSNLNVVPRLAESWELSDGGRRLTFALRKGVTWHDGTPFTSKDVVYTYESVRDTKRPTVWKAYLTNVQSMEAPDDHTVVVTYATPYGPALSSWSIGIIPSHLDEKQEPIGVGTGPYRFARWEPGKRIIVDAYDDYWGGRPNVDSIELSLNVPAVGQLELLKAGKLDLVEITDVADWSRQINTEGFRDRYEVSTEVESRFRMIAWNEQRELFEQRDVRLALTHAINRDRVIEEVLIGEARALSGPFFPTMYGADSTIAPYSFDLDRAAALLDTAGHPLKDGKRFTIELLARRSQRDQAMDQMLAIFRSDLASIGVELEVNFLDTRPFFERIILREFDAALLGWLPDIADPDPYALLHSSQINAGPNYAGYSNEQVDKWLEEARAQSDREARKQLYHKVHKLTHEEQPYTMLYAPYGHYAWSRRLRGVNPRDIGTQPRYPGVSRWWIEPTARN